MCGIVGISLRKDVQSRTHQINSIKNLFTKMLIRAQERGSAATGICIMTWDKSKEKPQAWVLRSPLPATEFVKTDDYKKILDKVDNNCLSLLGHTRAVSNSKAIAEDNRNNHPHMHGTIIGVHNGHVLNDDELWKKYSRLITPNGKCDSEIIIALINHFINIGKNISTEEAIDKTLKEVNARYALAIIDAKEPHKLHLVRDEHKPLSLGWWSSPEASVFASEWSYIENGYKDASTFNDVNCPILRHVFPSKQIITLDSTAKGKAWSDFYVGYHTLKAVKKDQQKLNDETQKKYEVRNL